MSQPISTVTATVIPEAVNYEILYLEQRAESDRLNSLLAVSRSAALKPARADDRRPVTTAEAVKRQLGPLALLNMTRDEKLKSLGIDPATVSDAALRKIFGRGNDGVAAKDLHISNPLQYRTLKEAALLLNVFGG